MDLDLALRADQPPSLSTYSFGEAKKEFEMWDCSNRMSLMIIKRDILETFKGTVSGEVSTAKEFLDDIEKCFVKNDKDETNTLLGNLVSIKYKDQENIREYIIQMPNIASKLKALKLELSDDLLVHLVLLSLPTQLSQFKVSYNCDLITIG